MDNVIEKLKNVPTAHVTDALRRFGITTGWPKGVNLIPGSKKEHFVGTARTLAYAPKERAPEQPLPGQFALGRMLRDGDVWVFAANGTGCWLTGDNACTVAMQNGAAAVICDGCMRDLADLKKMDIPVFCRGGSTKPYSSELVLVGYDCPVEFAGARINPGDIIVGDIDGIVIIPKEHIDDVLFQLEDIAELEENLAKAVDDRIPLDELNKLAKIKTVKRVR